MTDTKKAPGASPRFISDLRAWHKREQSILSGASIPTALDRKRGHSAFSGSPLLDLRQQIKVEIARDQLPTDVLLALEICHDIPTAENCWNIYQLMGGHGDGEQLYLWHAAIRGHQDAVPLLAITALQSRNPHDKVGYLMGLGLACGLMLHHGSFHPDDGLEAEDIEEARESGLARMRQFGVIVDEYDAAVEEGDAKVEQATGLDAALAEMSSATVEATLEDRGEIVRDAVPDFANPASGLVVVPQVLLLRPDSKHRQEIVAAAKRVAGQSLPLVGADKLASARVALRYSHPHLRPEIDRILNRQAGRAFPSFRLLLVGGAGGGKTSLAIGLAEALGMTPLVYAAGGVSDAAFGGTSSQYSSGRMSTPLQHVCETGIGNPVIVVDESDKIASGNQNGNLADVMLNLIEPSTAKRYLDPGLETSVDLSAVSWVLCANDISTIPVPLRDRCRIIRIPESGPEHIGEITKRIIAGIIEERGFHPSWHGPLDPDEVEVVKQLWPGGSMRVLANIVDELIENRERAKGMH